MTPHRPAATLSTLAVLTLSLPCAAPAQDARDLEARIDELMSEYQGDRPGAVVAVVEDGTVRFARAYGMASLEHGVALTRESVLDIGSVSKQFTAFAIALLVQRGELSLDDDIRTHLPEIPDFGSTITVRHLVHHMSGLREIYSALALAGYQGGDGIAQEDALHLTARMRELNFEPGHEYLYCNTGYMLLADIVSRVSGVPFPEFMEENVFGPLGMTHTTIMARRGQSIPNAAESYGPDDDDGYIRVFDNSGIQGAGGIYTTVDDLAAWMRNWGTAEVGGPEVLELITRRGVLAGGDTLDYAFGVNLGERRGLDVIAHGGSSAGFRASFTYLPELDGGVVTLSNFAGFDGDVPGEILAAAFGEHMEPEAVVEGAEGDAAEATGPAARSMGPEVEVDEAILEAYVGDYALRPEVVLRVTREGSTLFGEPTGQSRRTLTPTSDSTFRVESIAALTFHREADGAVTGLTIHQNGDHFARRREPWEPGATYLSALAGRYYSPELETVYTLVVEGGTLVARHRRHDDFQMEPLEEDAFAGADFFGTARFERSEAGEVTGMRVSNGRVRDLSFEKLDPDGAAPVTLGRRFSLDSEVLGEERAYWVYLPASYHQTRFAPRAYPVLYLLDGDAHFHSASGVVQFMSEGINGNLQVPEMIVVAIPNTDRTRDLTPTHTTLDYIGEESTALESSGGGDAFLRFLGDELVPEIEATYRTEPYRVLVGHSLGGLFALHALLEEPDLFQAHVAIDPSLWWDDQVLVQRARERLADPTDRRGSAYITLANNPPWGDADPEVMMEAGRAFARELERVATPRFRPGLRYFAGEDHGSVPLLSLYHGLLHTFEGYKVSVADVIQRPSSLDDHFDAVSERLGVDLGPPEAFVNSLGYLMLTEMDDVEKAIELFRLNVSNHPMSYNVHDSLGEAYMVNGDTALAIQSYERSLELNPDNENAREKLAELRGGS